MKRMLSWMLATAVMVLTGAVAVYGVMLAVFWLYWRPFAGTLEILAMGVY